MKLFCTRLGSHTHEQLNRNLPRHAVGLRASPPPFLWGAIAILCFGVVCTATLPGCAVLAGAAAGGATGYVAGHAAGKKEANETIKEHEHHDHDD